MTLGDKLFLNPYLYSGTVIARVTVCFATLLWALLMVFESSVDNLPSYHAIMGYRFMAGGLALVLSTYQVWCTFRWRRPSAVSEIASLVMASLWTAILLSYVWYERMPLPPAATSCTASVMLLSWWNLTAMPRR